jgi:hypothetical protein
LPVDLGHLSLERGYNVFRLGDGPWSVVFRGDTSTAPVPGQSFGVPVDGRVFASLPKSGTVVAAGAYLRLEVGAKGPVLTVGPDVWNTGAPWTVDDSGARVELLLDFEGWLSALETAEERGDLHPGATELLRTVAAHRLPATFAESLYLTYGCRAAANPPRGFFDVLPGMRLRLDLQARQFVPPSFSSELSGFVGAGSVFADVVSSRARSGAPSLSLGGFLGSFRFPGIEPGSGGGGGLVDLAVPLSGMRHIRVCYPPNPLPSPAGGGQADPSANVTVLGTAARTHLTDATDAFYDTTPPSTPTADGSPLPPPVVGYLRGRATVLAEIGCTVAGAPTWVAVGTTVRQLLEGPVSVPRLPRVLAGNAGPGTTAGAAFSRCYLRRHPAVDLAGALDQTNFFPVNLLGTDGPDATGADALDLPVLAGDCFIPPPPRATGA